MKHLYEEYEDTVLWKSVAKAINDLSDNQDIELTTNKDYVIGYICKMITEQGKGRNS